MFLSDSLSLFLSTLPSFFHFFTETSPRLLYEPSYLDARDLAGQGAARPSSPWQIIRSPLFEAPLTSLSATACPLRHQLTPAATSSILLTLAASSSLQLTPALPAHSCSLQLIPAVSSSHLQLPAVSSLPLQLPAISGSLLQRFTDVQRPVPTSGYRSRTNNGPSAFVILLCYCQLLAFAPPFLVVRSIGTHPSRPAATSGDPDVI
ncbi:unnamed protein product [Acanthosepion pharaonis]|uniref:Uncharacterized protein n=1 Tax=Acanthosepion pharaonis TaxID=158019 RepID=A0A812DEQ6_ACAPH|nr:unnamed protein product [Sepia pharaonis]